MITKLYVKTSLFLSEFKKDQRGVTAIEYGLIGVAMAVAVGIAFSATGDKGFLAQLKAAFLKIGTEIKTASGTK